MKIIYVVLGVVMAVAGAAGAVWSLGSDSVASLGVGIAAGSVAFVGVVFLFVARYFGGLDDRSVLASGIPGTGQVLSVRDTGVTVNNLNAVIKAHVLVSIPTRQAYEADMRVLLRGRAGWGTIQPGMTIPIKVDPADHTKVVLDVERPVMPTMTGGLGGLGATAMAAGATVPNAGGVPVVTMSTADIIAAGVATDGRLLSVEPTGLTAGHVVGGLPSEHADDPIVKVALTFVGLAGAEVRSESLMRVPDGKAGYLASGDHVPVRYLPDTPSTGTIDWDRL